MAQLMICPHCGSTGVGTLRGSLWITLLLLLLWIIPGLIYEAWRCSQGRTFCKRCRTAGMIPADSPAGRAIAKGMQS